MNIGNVTSDRRVDPDPFTIAFTIIGATTGVVGMIDVIRRAIRQERLDWEEEARRRESDEEKEHKQKLKRQKIALERLDAHLEITYDKLLALKRIFSEDKERIHGTPNYLLDARDFERYRVQAMQLVGEVSPIMECILSIEPELDPKFILPPEKIIEDGFDSNEREVLTHLDQTWLQMLKGRIDYNQHHQSDPFEAVIPVVELARRKIDFVLNDPVIRKL